MDVANSVALHPLYPSALYNTLILQVSGWTAKMSRSDHPTVEILSLQRLRLGSPHPRKISPFFFLRFRHGSLSLSPRTPRPRKKIPPLLPSPSHTALSLSPPLSLSIALTFSLLMCVTMAMHTCTHARAAAAADAVAVHSLVLVAAERLAVAVGVLVNSPPSILLHQ